MKHSRRIDNARTDAVVALGCVLCGMPAIPHHVPPDRRRPGDRTDVRIDDAYIIPLCPFPHHDARGPLGEAIHAGRQSWVERHGTEADWLDEVDRRLTGG